MRCAGIVLTGGASSRLGLDKAALRLRPGGPTLAERAAAVLAQVASPVIEIGPTRTGLPTAAEPPGRQGPLVALAAGIQALGTEMGSAHGVLLLACDMPMVTAELLRWLVDHPSPGSVVPRGGDPPHPQPLCARWSAAALSIVPLLVAGGERALRPLVAYDDVLLVDAETWSEHAGPYGADALADVDTPAQLARVRALLTQVDP